MFRDVVPDDRGVILLFWPHPERFDQRLGAAVGGAENLVAAMAVGIDHGAAEGDGSGRGDAGESDAGEGDGVVVGIASVRWGGGCDDTGRPLLYGVKVRPDQRGRGFGTALIRHAAGLVVTAGSPGSPSRSRSATPGRFGSTTVSGW